MRLNHLPARIAPTVVLAALSSPLLAQSFDYPDFSSIAGLTLNGDSVQAGNVLRVTSAAISERGSVYYSQPVSVSGGFQTTFTFQFTNPAAGGGDGLVFIVQNDPVAGLAALGNHASALGYGGFLATPGNAIDNALVVEFDTYQAGSWGDPSGNHISIHSGGTGDCGAHEDFSIGSVTPVINMSDGAVHTARIAYDGAAISVYLDDLMTPILTAPWTFAGGGAFLNGGNSGGMNLAGGTSAWVGFTAGNGGAWEDHDVLSWSFGAGGIGTTYCSPAEINTTGSPAVITATGSALAADMDLTLTGSQLPPGQFAYFIASQTQGFVANPNSSQGNLCVVGTIARFNAQIGGIDPAGTFSIVVDTQNIPVSPAVPITAGDTWNFQCWNRDFIAGQGPTSNFTDAVSITFQ